jgi:hypothetical protein
MSIMKTINVCQMQNIKQRERRAAARREMLEALKAVGVIVGFILLLGIEDLVEHIL